MATAPRVNKIYYIPTAYSPTARTIDYVRADYNIEQHAGPVHRVRCVLSVHPDQVI